MKPGSLTEWVRWCCLKCPRKKLCGRVQLVLPGIIFIWLLLDYTQYQNIMQQQLREKRLKQRTSRVWLTYLPQGRLGNQLFQYASAHCMASSNNYTLAIIKDSFLPQLFPSVNATLITARDVKSQMQAFQRLKETKPGVYDKNLIKTVKQSSTNIFLCCFFQSWKYFQDCEKKLRVEFVPPAQTTALVDDILREHVKQFTSHPALSAEKSLTCVHIRRGDMTQPSQTFRGYDAAPLSYLLHAMDFMKRKLSQTLFLIVTDDPAWSQEHILPVRKDTFLLHIGNKFNMSIAKSRSDLPVEDELALVEFLVMSKCNHSIITTGSFGWWGAWLANGITVYYKDYPRAQSDLAKQYKHLDYYPSSWIPMT